MKLRILATILATFLVTGIKNVAAQTLQTVPQQLLSAIPATPASDSTLQLSDDLIPALAPSPIAPQACVPSDDSNRTYQPFAGCTDAYGHDPAGFKFTWGPDKWAKVGAAVRSSFNSSTYPAPGVGGNYFTIDNARLLTSGQVTKYVGFELNSDVSLSQSLTPSALTVPSTFDLLDAIVKVEASDLVNVWVGQFLPPSDRSNIDGPFFINGWDFPFVSNYPAIFQGRQIGAAYWGQYNGGMLKWSVGAFNGSGGTLQSPYTNPPDSPPGPNNNIRLDARVTLNFLDPEPGYYHQSSYYGEKEILAVGFAMQTQHNAYGTAANPVNFTGVSVDALYETKFENNTVLTLEGAYYHFNDQDLVTSSQQGESGFVYAGVMLPYVTEVGPIRGRWRPFVRYQQYNHDFQAASTGLYSQGLDLGTEFVINGPNARLTAVWSDRDVIGGGTLQIFRLAAQVVF